MLIILLMDFNSELQLFYENTEIGCGLAWSSNVALGLVPHYPTGFEPFLQIQWKL